MTTFQITIHKFGIYFAKPIWSFVRNCWFLQSGGSENMELTQKFSTSTLQKKGIQSASLRTEK